MRTQTEFTIHASDILIPCLYRDKEASWSLPYGQHAHRADTPAEWPCNGTNDHGLNLDDALSFLTRPGS